MGIMDIMMSMISAKTVNAASSLFKTISGVCVCRSIIAIEDKTPSHAFKAPKI